MSITTPSHIFRKPRCSMAFAMVLSFAAAQVHASTNQETNPMTSSHIKAADASATLNARQQAIIPIAAFAATGEISKLNLALNQGLDAGLTVSEAKEVLIQLYAYAGFPRSLNALGELMKVMQSRKQRGIEDPEGNAPSRPIPTGDALMAAGTANQTKLSGGLVGGPLFEFVPTANAYLRAHLFGDIFERDNLDWQSRELATVGMLSVISGAEPQLLAHMRISMNVGITEGQLRQLIRVLAANVNANAAERAREALDKQIATLTNPKP